MSTAHYSDCIDGAIFDTRRASLLARGVRRMACPPLPGQAHAQTTLWITALYRDYRSRYFWWGYAVPPGALTLINVIAPLTADDALALFRACGHHAVGYERAFVWTWPRRWAADRYDAIRPTLTLRSYRRARKLLGGGALTVGIAGWVEWLAKLVPVLSHWLR